MDIEFKNVGFIRGGKIKTNKITIIFGPNNVGKTYLSYSTYAVLKKYNDAFMMATPFKKTDATNLIENGSLFFDIFNCLGINSHKNICGDLAKELPKFFKDTTGLFKNSEINVTDDINKKDIIASHFAITMIVSQGLHLNLSKEKGSNEITFNLIKFEIEGETKKTADSTSAVSLTSYMNMLFRHCVKNEVLDSFMEKPFIITSERTGISLFLKEIDGNRNNIVDQIATESIQNEYKENYTLSIKDLFERRVSNFSEPITDNINVMRESLSDNNSLYEFRKKDARRSRATDFKKVTESLDKLLNGKYVISKKEVNFLIKGSDGEECIIPISLSSASNKSLFLFDLYINKYLNKNAYLIIDEPELNLHPQNQIKMAELLVRLSNYGVKIIITTHSDYIVKEINNRIMAKQIKKPELLKELGYSDIDLIDAKDVNAFTISDKGYIEEVDKNKYGVNAYLFDNVILDVDARASILYSETEENEYND